MNSLEAHRKLAKHIFRLLKMYEITFPIGRTNKGNLGIKFTAINDDYEIMLDAVPLATKNILEDENNIELKKMIEKYWLGVVPMDSVTVSVPWVPMPEESEITNMVGTTGDGRLPEKKRGRPFGAKNKVKVKTAV